MSETVEFIDVNGTATTLPVTWDVQGRFMPPIAMEEDEVPEQHGSRLRAVRHRARDFALTLWITAATDEDLRTQLRALAARMDPLRGDCRIRVTAPGGDQREITCRYQGGLELRERLGETSAPGVQKATVMFRAHDPYWYATSPVVEDFELSTNGAKWFPFFPLRLSSSSIFAAPTVTNPGDVYAGVQWLVRGPGSALVLRNGTTGKQLALATVLGAGEEVTIDTRRNHKSVTLDDGTATGENLFGDVTGSLWDLAYGVNSISVEFNGATSASLVRLTYTPPYLTT